MKWCSGLFPQRQNFLSLCRLARDVKDTCPAIRDIGALLRGVKPNEQPVAENLQWHPAPNPDAVVKDEDFTESGPHQ